MKSVVYNLIVLFLLTIISTNSIHAQTTYSVTGKVMGSNEPLIGANVVLKGTNNNQNTLGASTDINGAFHIQAPKGKYNIEITYIGYSKYIAQVEVNENVTLPSIQLSEDSQQLDAVVVTAKTITYNANGYIAEISKNPFYRDQDINSIL